MKKLLSMAAALFLGLIVCSCSGTKKAASGKTLPEYTGGEPGISMTVEPEKYPTVPQLVKLTITNNTDGIAQFGADYRVDKWIAGAWDKWDFPETFPVIMILYSLPPQGSDSYQINLFSDRIKYTPGLYRVVKNIHVNEKSSEFYAEFTIE